MFYSYVQIRFVGGQRRVLGVGSSCVAPSPPNEERIEWNINLCLFRERGKRGGREAQEGEVCGGGRAIDLWPSLCSDRGEIFFRPERDHPQFTRQREKYYFF